MRLVFCFVFPLNQTVIASPYFRRWLYASPYTHVFTSYSLQITPFAFYKASLLVWNTSKPRFGYLSQCFVSCETIWPSRKMKHCFMWNAITTFTQSLFYRAVTHKALLFAPAISGYASTIHRISTLATYRDKYSRLLQVHLLRCRAILWALHRVTYHTLPFSGFRLLHIVSPRKAKHSTKACAWNSSLFRCSFKQDTLFR